MDFRSPSIGDICNFFWYLFNDLNRCPSTIEGYRTAIADTLGNTKQNICTNPEIARLIASFHRDKPKSSRSIPKWNLSLVLQRLNQPPFEPQEEAALKFLTWKTVFLLALALVALTLVALTKSLEGHKNPQSRLYPFPSRTTNFDQVSSDNKWLYQFRNSYIPDGALHTRVLKNAVEKVTNQTSLAFFNNMNKLFLVLRPNNKWRPIRDLSSQNKYLKSEAFKMYTGEHI